MRSDPAPTAGPDQRQRGTGPLLAVLGACFLMVMMDNTILNVALETIQRELGASTSQLQWAVDSYIVVYAALMFTAGVLADRWGRRRTLAIGLVLFAVASAFAAMADSPTALIVWRALMGIGGAVVPPATLAIIKESVPRERQGAAMGVWSAIGGLSVAFGPILGGILLEQFWWGSVFLINVPLALVCAALLMVVARESRSRIVVPPDLPGILLSMAAVGTLVYGVIRAGDDGRWLALPAAGPIALGVLLMVALVAVERRTRHPALDVALFRNRSFAAGTAAISGAFFALTGGTFLLVFYVQLVLDRSPLGLGLLLLPVAVGSVVSAVGSAWAVSRVGYRVAVTSGLVLLIAALAGLLGLDRTSPVLVLEIALLVAGLGMGLTMGATTALAMSAVSAERAGVGSAVNNTLRQVGAALGVAATGSVLSVTYRDLVTPRLAALPPDLRADAADSLSATSVLLERLRPAIGPERYAEAVRSAQDAFVEAMHTALWVGIAVLVVCAVLAAIWAPGRRAGTDSDGPGAEADGPRADAAGDVPADTDTDVTA